MNLKKFQHIGERIEADSPKDKEKMLFKKINEISLIYAEKKFQDIKIDNKDYKFSEVVKNFTPIKNTVLESVYNLEGFKFFEHKEKIDLFLESFYKEIDSMYKVNGFNLNGILDLVNSKKDSIKDYLDVNNLKERKHSKKEKNTKLLNFNQIKNNIRMTADDRYGDLVKFGFSKLDQLVEVHIDNFYKTGEPNLGLDLINSDLGVVAEHIIDEEPETAAVVGTSWLLDTPLAKRLGFKKYEADAVSQNDFSTWLQFIDKNGQINRKRFKKFIKTGELPFKSFKAYISVEDFLKRYLPNERKGKIVLKELNIDREKFWISMLKEMQSLKAEWGSLLKRNEGFEDFAKNKTINELLDFVDLGSKKKYLDFFRKMYDKKIPWKEFFNHKNKDIKKIDKEIEKAMKADQYKDREIVI